MTCFYLLRNNQELGPYTLSELKAMDLYVSDLIWISDESTCWQHPHEIDGFANIVASPVTSVNKQTKTETGTLTESAQKLRTNACLLPREGSERTTAGEYDDPPSFEKLKEKYKAKAPKQERQRSKLNIGANLVGISVFLIGVFVTTFMVKKAVENITYEQVKATAVAQEINPDNTMVSTSSQMAISTKQTLPAISMPTEPNGRSIQPKPVKTASLQTVSVPSKSIDKTELSPEEHKAPESMVQTELQPLSHQAGKFASEEVIAPENTSETVTDRDVEKKKNEAIKLSANDFKVGFFGGISDLELSVLNPSSRLIGKASVEVDYMKPSGKVVASQTVEIIGIAPGSTKKVSVPDIARGVKVRYRIINIE